METLPIFDARSYDRTWLERLSPEEVRPAFLETRLTPDTAALAAGARAVSAFVNDDLSAPVLEKLRTGGTEAVLLRCAGYNNADLAAAAALGLRVLRVPAYSPSSVAEHTLALLLSLTRQTHRAFTRTRERNFSLEGLVGRDLAGSTAGIVGTGRVGLAFAAMCRALGMRVLGYDTVPTWGRGIEYVTLEELLRRSDVVSLHCPLTPATYHLISRASLRSMRPGAILLNTSRGALVDAEAVLDAVKTGKLAAVGLDVYEEEAGTFFENVSDKIMRDDTLNLLLSQPNVLVTGHQAYLTDHALKAIAAATWENYRAVTEGRESENEVRAEKETV